MKKIGKKFMACIYIIALTATFALVCVENKSRDLSNPTNEFWAGASIAATASGSEGAGYAVAGMAAVHGATWAVIGSAVALGPAAAPLAIGFAL